MAKSAIKSPSYPSVPFANALDSVAKIEAQYRSSSVDREEAAKLIGFSALSGPATNALAALASYGLVERAGKGMLRVTPLARSILYPANENERVEGTIRAAMHPSLFKEIREQFPDVPVPPEGGVVNYLNRAGFNPNAVPKAAKAFLSTAEMLQGLEVPESHRPDEQDRTEYDSPDAKTVSGGAAVGDLIQWECQGALQFETPRRIRWISEDGDWLAVEGSDTGIPMSQVTVEQVGAKAPPPIPPAQPQTRADTTPVAGQRKAVFPVSEGDVTFLFPDGMTEEGIEELEAYLAVFLKKEKRKASEN
ncbi:MAG: hypothetical protein ACK5MY_07020 [Jhaorihella sp.]